MTLTTGAGRHWGDAGQVAGIEALPFGLLVFVVGSLLVASAWAVVDVKQTLAVASREGARTFVEGRADPVAESAALDAVEDTVAGLGRDPDRLSVAVAGSTRGRCGRVTVRVAYRLPAVAMPFVGGIGPGITVHSSHSEVIDPYRSGLSGAARCAS